MEKLWLLFFFLDHRLHTMRLIIATPSPFARKIRVVVREKNIACDEDIHNPWNTDSTITELNPLGQIPILTTDDQQQIFDSRVIFDYLEKLEPAHSLLPSDPVEQIQTRKIESVGDGISDATVLLVMEAHRPKHLQSSDWMERQQKKVENSLHFLDNRLKNRNWFVGDEFTLADISVGCALSYIDLRLPYYIWREHFPNLSHFSERIEQRSSFKNTLLTAQEIAPVL